ncbi:unnamed protein product [Sphagnum compactum]
MPQLTPELDEASGCIVLSTEWHEGGTIHLAPPRLQTKIGLQDQDLKDCLDGGSEAPYFKFSPSTGQGGAGGGGGTLPFGGGGGAGQRIAPCGGGGDSIGWDDAT